MIYRMNNIHSDHEVVEQVFGPVGGHAYCAESGLFSWPMTGMVRSSGDDS